jgi:hypothetical protein
MAICRIPGVPYDWCIASLPERGSAGEEMPTKRPQLSKPTPRLHIAVARGLVSDAVARLREAGRATALG